MPLLSAAIATLSLVSAISSAGDNTAKAGVTLLDIFNPNATQEQTAQANEVVTLYEQVRSKSAGDLGGESIQDLIENPLTACAEVQGTLNLDYITNILQLLQKDEESGQITPAMVTMSLPGIGADGGNADVSLPLLSFVQPTLLGISRCTIDFESSVKNGFSRRTTSQTTQDNNTTQTAGWLERLTKGARTSKITTNSKDANNSHVNGSSQMKYHVSVTAEQIQNEGMTFLQALFKELATKQTSLDTPVAVP